MYVCMCVCVCCVCMCVCVSVRREEMEVDESVVENRSNQSWPYDCPSVSTRSSKFFGDETN